MKVLSFLLLLVPLAAFAQDAALGRSLYRSHCATCHGPEAHGDGWMARYLTRRPARLSALAQKNGGTFPRERVIAKIDGRNETETVHGPREMPVFGDSMKRDLVLRSRSDPEVRKRIEALADYLATIQE